MSTPYPLGRVVEHDPRSREYRYVPPRGAALASVRHSRYATVTDQGTLGSCTGHAGNSVLSTGATCYGRLREAQRDRLGPDLATQLYSRGTQLDDFPGAYPPSDTGSSGLAVCKAMRELGYISGYQWTFNLSEALAALAAQPVMLGIPWYSEMFYPSATGQLIAPKGDISFGGHEVCLDELDVPNRRVWLCNSWGREWGQGGRAWMTWELLARLLADSGDVAVPLVPRSSIGLWERLLRALGF